MMRRPLAGALLIVLVCLLLNTFQKDKRRVSLKSGASGKLSI